MSIPNRDFHHGLLGGFLAFDGGQPIRVNRMGALEGRYGLNHLLEGNPLPIEHHDLLGSHSSQLRPVAVLIRNSWSALIG